jgi:hypothetical protein
MICERGPGFLRWNRYPTRLIITRPCPIEGSRQQLVRFWIEIHRLAKKAGALCCAKDVGLENTKPVVEEQDVELSHCLDEALNPNSRIGRSIHCLPSFGLPGGDKGAFPKTK